MIKKPILYVILSFLFCVSCTTQKKEYDTRAIASLDAMSEAIGNLTSCSYTVNIVNNRSESVEVIKEDDVYMRGPNKMYIHSNRSDGMIGYWFNGETLSYFSYTKNEHSTIKIPGTIIDAIDFSHEKFGIDFPASDFFYPKLTEDLISQYNSIFYVGEVEFDGLKCISIVANNNEETLQIWIHKESNLPRGMLIESKINKAQSYEAIFSNLKVDPSLPDALFEFSAPSDSKQIQLQPKK
ncbi:DUF2092 domain-containing protein [Flavicella sp.]|uniref:DUF2092 domain-containing protein n=1 Tax=Flavicella sp. TaxID=2957742 RepID=UPI003016EB6C